MRSRIGAALLAAALLLQTAAKQVRAQEQRWSVAEGQPLADASVLFGLRNADVTFTIPALTILSLANSSFGRANDSQAVGGKAYADGTLTIQGAVPINTSSYELVTSSVFDTGMRAGLLPTPVRPMLEVSDAAGPLAQWGAALASFCLPPSLLRGVRSKSAAATPDPGGMTALHTCSWWTWASSTFASWTGRCSATAWPRPSS